MPGSWSIGFLHGINKWGQGESSTNVELRLELTHKNDPWDNHQVPKRIGQNGFTAETAGFVRPLSRLWFHAPPFRAHEEWHPEQWHLPSHWLVSGVARQRGTWFLLDSCWFLRGCQDGTKKGMSIWDFSRFSGIKLVKMKIHSQFLTWFSWDNSPSFFEVFEWVFTNNVGNMACWDMGIGSSHGEDLEKNRNCWIYDACWSIKWHGGYSYTGLCLVYWVSSNSLTGQV